MVEESSAVNQCRSSQTGDDGAKEHGDTNVVVDIFHFEVRLA